MSIIQHLFILLFTLSTATGVISQSHPGKVDVGDKAYDFTGYDQDGNEIKVSDFEGQKYVLLNFTATYCGPCWKTYEPMNNIQEKYSKNLKVISFHWDDAKEHWRKMAEKAGIDFKCTSIWDAIDKEKVSEAYQIDGWPYFFLINKEGVIIEKWFGNSKRKLRRKVRKHL